VNLVLQDRKQDFGKPKLNFE